MKAKHFQVKDPDKEDLPPTKDKKFWGKSQTTLIHEDELQRPDMSKHKKLIMRGPFVICQSCPFEHTIPGHTLDKNGKLVKLDKPIKK